MDRRIGAQRCRGPYPDPDFLQLDSWIVIRADNTATFFVGKTDLGQGTGTAFRQIMCDELDIAYEKTSCVMGSTHNTVDQGGSGGSDALQTDGYPMRRVAAEARRVLLDMAATRLGVPVSALAVSDGVISVIQTPSTPEVRHAETSVTYGDLIGGKKFNVTLTGKNTDTTTGIAKLKPVQQMKNVGKSPQRYDIPPKVDGSLKWAVDMKAPGMVHARNVRPPVAGATLVSIDESSVKSIPGFVKVVSKGNYVAVVCEREENAIRAARQLKVEWKKPATAPFPTSDNLFSYMRSATPSSTGKPVETGNVDAAFASAATVIEAEYDVPFQGHTSFGPAHAMADPSNGQMTIYTNDMKSYGMRNGVAEFLKMPRDQVRVIWMDGPQGYGRTAADDAGFEAAYIAKEIGQAGEGAVEPAGRDGVGHQGSRLCLQDARRPRRPGEHRRAALRRVRGGSQSPGLQRARDGADLAADGHAQEPHLAGPRLAAVGHVRHPQSPADDARGAVAHAVRDPSSHGQPARPRRPASPVRARVVHRRARGQGQGRPSGVPPADAAGQHAGRQRLQARPLDCLHQGGGREVRLGFASVAEVRRSVRKADGGGNPSGLPGRTSSPAAASPTPTAARPSSP